MPPKGGKEGGRKDRGKLCSRDSGQPISWRRWPCLPAQSCLLGCSASALPPREEWFFSRVLVNLMGSGKGAKNGSDVTCIPKPTGTTGQLRSPRPGSRKRRLPTPEILRPYSFYILCFPPSATHILSSLLRRRRDKL